MTRAKTLLGLLLLLSTHARALAPVHLETIWNEKQLYISTTGVTSVTIDVGGFGAAGAAIPGNTWKRNGVDSSTFGKIEVVTSTAPNVVLFDFTAYSSTGAFSLQMAQTIKMPAPVGLGVNANPNTTITSTSTYSTPYPASYLFTQPVISTSSLTSWPQAVALTQDFKAAVANPILYVTNLSASSTFYLSLKYGVPRTQ